MLEGFHPAAVKHDNHFILSQEVSTYIHNNVTTFYTGGEHVKMDIFQTEKVNTVYIFTDIY